MPSTASTRPARAEAALLPGWDTTVSGRSIGARRWWGPGSSILLHLLFVGGCLLPVWRADQEGAESRTTVVTVPMTRLVERKSRRKPQLLQPPGLPGRPAEPDADAASPPPERLNLSAIQLSFADDVLNALPEVVRSQHGMLALVDGAGDRSVARFLFEPPLWELRRTMLDISGTLRIQMDPPGKWEVFRRLARRHHLPLDSYRAFAIFDLGYGRCLQDAILRRALSGGWRPGMRVSAARLVFATASPCGIEALEVSLAIR